VEKPLKQLFTFPGTLACENETYIYIYRERERERDKEMVVSARRLAYSNISNYHHHHTITWLYSPS
jgi:hypothetical protein